MADRLTESGDRPRLVARLEINQAQVVMPLGEIRLQLDRRGECRDNFVRARAGEAQQAA